MTEIADGLHLVTDAPPSLGGRLREATDRPVTRVVHSRAHADHADGRRLETTRHSSRVP